MCCITDQYFTTDLCPPIQSSVEESHTKYCTAFASLFCQIGVCSSCIGKVTHTHCQLQLLYQQLPPYLDTLSCNRTPGLTNLIELSIHLPNMVDKITGRDNCTQSAIYREKSEQHIQYRTMQQRGRYLPVGFLTPVASKVCLVCKKTI